MKCMLNPSMSLWGTCGPIVINPTKESYINWLYMSSSHNRHQGQGCFWGFRRVCETIYGLVHKKYTKIPKYCKTSYSRLTRVFLGIDPMTFQLLVHQRSYCRAKITYVHNSMPTENLATKKFMLSNLSLHLQVWKVKLTSQRRKRLRLKISHVQHATEAVSFWFVLRVIVQVKSTLSCLHLTGHCCYDYSSATLPKLFTVTMKSQ